MTSFLPLALLVSFVNLFALLAADAPAKTYVIQTVAGSNFAGDGGPALSAVLSQPEGIAVDRLGNIYVADAEDNRVRRISPGGTIQTVAGTGVAGFAGDGGPANAALLNQPYGLAVDAAGNLYIADLGNARVREITASGTIQTVAGGGGTPPAGIANGGPATSAQMLQPRNVAVDSTGSLYISDFGANRVYRVTGGTLVALAGTGDAGIAGDGGPALAAQLNAPAGLAADSQGALYIADSGNNCVRKVVNGMIGTIYNVPSPTGLTMDNPGNLYVASATYVGTLSQPLAGIASARDIAADTAGNLYVSTGPFVIEANADGDSFTIAGSGASRYFGGDGGPATNARLYTPSGIVVDTDGTAYIADTANNRIRKITPGGLISTLAGTGDAGAAGDNGPASAAQLNAPRSVAVDALHNVYVADTGNNEIRRITPDGTIVSFDAQVNNPQSIAVDGAGSVYIADTGNNRIVQVTAAGVASTVTQILQPMAISVGSAGAIYISDATAIWQFPSGGALTKLLDGLNAPGGTALNADGNLLIAEAGGNVIRSLAPSGALTIIAGTGTAGFSGDGYVATTAQLNTPTDLTIDSNGTVWVADSGNNRIRSLTPSAAPADSTTAATLVNAASMASGPIAAGEIVTIFGAGFDPAQTELLFDGKPATVFYTSATQINALAPETLTPGSNTEVTIQVDGVAAADWFVPVANSAPGIFTTASGTGLAAANNQDGSINSASNPAARGSVVSLYATGQGNDLSKVGATIAGYTAEVLYAGPAPGFPGLMQINVQVPAGFLPPGTQPVVLSIGTAQSQPGVTLAID
ncbi:MAG TPA: IPT/TIG domain-containing protein [Bryobacteraceae bacterium]|nr:IPT/TIG domain-containing protein [Bryobacteraceae bacterium]